MAVNPRNGQKIFINNRNTVLLFGLGEEEQNMVGRSASDHYFVVNCEDDFTDLLALPAGILIVNPLKINNENIDHFNECYSDNIDGPVIIITKPFPTAAKFVYILVDLTSNPCSLERTFQIFESRQYKSLMSVVVKDKLSSGVFLK